MQNLQLKELSLVDYSHSLDTYDGGLFLIQKGGSRAQDQDGQGQLEKTNIIPWLSSLGAPSVPQ